MDKLTQEDKDFIVDALNAYWYNAHQALNSTKPMGDMEKKNCEHQVKKSKELMKKFGCFD
jgi:hypothetical protein